MGSFASHGIPAAMMVGRRCLSFFPYGMEILNEASSRATLVTARGRHSGRGGMQLGYGGFSATVERPGCLAIAAGGRGDRSADSREGSAHTGAAQDLVGTAVC